MQHRLIIFSVAVLFVPRTASAQVEISTDFPGGNVLVLKSEAETVRLKPDLRGGRDWFYWHFESTAAKPGSVEFVFEGKLRIGVRGPAFSTDGGLNWNWLGTDTVRYSEKGAGGDTEVTESFRYQFKEAGEKIRFAVAIPYRQRELDEFLERVERNPHLTRSELTRTRGGKAVELLRIGEPGTGKEAIIVSARHHACESMASYVLEGFIETAMSETPAGRSFRQRFVLYAVPMMDKDGVQAGDQGKWRFPHDHNRDYGVASIYPEVIALQKLAREVDVKLAVDFHCPSLRGESHEVFYFVGVGHPQIRDNIDELKRWIGEERPQEIRTAPFNWVRDPPAKAPQNLKGGKFSEWFAYIPGIKLAATFEIPYTQASCNMDASMARDYGRSLLRAWQHSEFTSEPETRSDHGSAGLLAFRKEFSAIYKSRPDAAEAMAMTLLADSETPGVFLAEARNSMGLLRQRQRNHEPAIQFFEQVIADPHATTGQRLTAATQRVATVCRIPDSKAESVTSAISAFDTFPHPSAASQFDAYGAAAAFFVGERRTRQGARLHRAPTPARLEDSAGRNIEPDCRPA